VTAMMMMMMMISGFGLFFFVAIYGTESMYSMFRNKLQNFSLNQFESIFTAGHR